MMAATKKIFDLKWITGFINAIRCSRYCVSVTVWKQRRDLLTVFVYGRSVVNRRIAYWKGHIVGDESRRSREGVVMKSSEEALKWDFQETETMWDEVIFWGCCEGKSQIFLLLLNRVSDLNVYFCHKYSQ